MWQKQLEKKTGIRHFAMKWLTSPRVNKLLSLERQTRASLYGVVNPSKPGQKKYQSANHRQN